MNKKPDNLRPNFLALAFAGILWLGGAIIGLVFFYGLLRMFFRYAFDVELPNPFN